MASRIPLNVAARDGAFIDGTIRCRMPIIFAGGIFHVANTP